MIDSANWAQALTISLKAGWTDEKVSEQLSDLVEVLDELNELFLPAVSESFLFGNNSALGARPIDVLWYGQKEQVLEAVAVQREFSYA